MEKKLCPSCNKELTLDNFNFRNRASGRLCSHCKKCTNDSVTALRNQKRDFINTEKSQKGCCKCKEDRFYCLDLHHTDPNEKDFGIAKAISKNYSLDRIKAEMEKCIVFCSNCHREFHYLEETEQLTLEQYLGQ